MATTILPKKAINEIPIATDDEAHEQLVADPAIPQFGATNGTNLSSPGPTAFGASTAGGYGYPGSYSPSTASIAPGAMSAGYGSTTNINQSIGQQPVLTGAAPANAASNADVLVANDNSDWINKKWRPAMGWVYMLTCTMDFIIFPILWSILQSVSKGAVTQQWQPLTLQGAGLYHIAMGAVLGIAAYGRTKEKLEAATKN
jgi:hypothetical protein